MGFFLMSLILVPNVFAAPIRGWNNYPPRYNMMGMMWEGGNNGRLSSWLWLFTAYHIVVALVFLLILMLIVVILWKKIQLMDHEVNKRK